MRIAVDFDGTIVSQDDRAHDDLGSPLRLMPGAREALGVLKASGHVVIVFSARANRALRCDPLFDPLASAGKSPVPGEEAFAECRRLSEARYRQMVEFVRENLADVVDAVDDGHGGKVVADLYVDDRGLRYGEGPDAMNWWEIAESYGGADV